MKRTPACLVAITLVLALAGCTNEEPRESASTLPISSTVTSVMDLYGAGCPKGWEYRRHRSALLDIQFREPQSYGSGPPPIWAEFYPFPDGYFDERGDPRIFAEALAAAGEFRVERIADATWDAQRVTVMDLVHPETGLLARSLIWRGTTSLGGNWLTVMLKAQPEFRAEFGKILSGFRPLMSQVELKETTIVPPWEPCPSA